MVKVSYPKKKLDELWKLLLLLFFSFLTNINDYLEINFMM